MATPRRRASGSGKTSTPSSGSRRGGGSTLAERWRVPIVVGIAGLAVIALGIGLLSDGGGLGDDGGVDIGAPRASSAGFAGLSEAELEDMLAATDLGEDLEEGVPTVTSIAELHEVFGEPPFADVGRVRIPSLGVDAPISFRLVGDDGVLPNPVGPDEVSLYDLSALPGMGGLPGEEGSNAVLSGHVDQRTWLEYAQVNYVGLGIFAYLDNLTPGQQIDLEVYGGFHSYVVEWVREVGASSGGEWNDILSATPGVQAITLITCGGDFDPSSATYASRTVVRAVKVG